jgi:hypothetical protein
MRRATTSPEESAMEFFSTARFTRGLAVATTLAVVITCASPTSPTSSSTSRTGSFGSALLSNPVNVIRSVAVSLADAQITVGDTTVARAVLRNNQGRIRNNRKPRWSSDKTDIARVDSITGVVRAVGAGTALIIASVDDVSGSAAVLVDAPVPTPAPPPPPPTATRLVMVTQPPTSAVSGTAMSPSPSVGLRDASNNAVAQAGVNVTVAIGSGGGTLGGLSTIATDANGVATFSGLSITGPAGPRVLTFSAPSLTAATSSTINISDAAPPPPAAPQPPGSANVLFASDWSTATGTSDAALRDTSKPLPWTMLGGQGLEVIPSAGLDFPTTNVLRVTAIQATSGFGALRRSGLPVPAVGESRFYRWYSRVAIGDGVASGDPETHPHQDGQAGSQINWSFNVHHDLGAAGMWTPQLRTQSGINAWPNHWWTGPALSKNVTYRFELQVHRTGTGTFNLHVRIYDTNGNLLHDDASFRNDNGTATLASRPTLNFNTVSSLDGFNAGLNGLAGSDWFPSRVYMYQGAIAVCGTDWCGPYRP